MVNTFETKWTNTTISGRVETLRHDRLDYVTDPGLTRPGELLKADVRRTGRHMYVGLDVLRILSVHRGSNALLHSPCGAFSGIAAFYLGPFRSGEAT